MQNEFSFTTRQAARLLGIEQHCLRDGARRSGQFKGMAPRRVGRALLWPRRDVLALAQTPLLPDARATVDLRALLPFAEARGLPAADAAVEALLMSFADPRPLLTEPAALHADDAAALGAIVTGHVRRLQADTRLYPGERNDALLALARAIAPALLALPDHLIEQGTQEALSLGGAA